MPGEMPTDRANLITPRARARSFANPGWHGHAVQLLGTAVASAASGNAGIGNIRSATIRTLPPTWITRTSTRASMVWWSTRRIGRTRRFVDVRLAGSIRRDGWAAAMSPKRWASGGEETGGEHNAAWDG